MTSHQLAAKLLAHPDLPVFHFDPSLVDYESGDPEDGNVSLSTPEVTVYEADGEDIKQSFIEIAGQNSFYEEPDHDLIEEVMIMKDPTPLGF